MKDVYRANWNYGVSLFEWDAGLIVSSAYTTAHWRSIILGSGCVSPYFSFKNCRFEVNLHVVVSTNVIVFGIINHIAC